MCEGKECLTVLNFVGQAHKNYDFEQKFKALIGKSKHSIEYNINNGFLNLPKGCYIHLEKQAKEYILRNIKGAKYFREMKLDAFFITLNKSEKDYSPSTLYEDYAINERLFHW